MRRSTSRTAVATLVPALLASTVALAQEVDPGTPEGAERTAYEVRAFDQYPLPVREYFGNLPGSETISGKVVWSSYRLADGADSAIAVIEAYRTRLLGQGFETLFECVNQTCGGLSFRFDVALLPAPAMLVDAASFAQLTMRRAAVASDDAEGGEVHVSILASEVLGVIYIQTVVVTPASTDVRITEAPTPPEDDSDVVLPADDKAFFDALMETGHLAIDGLEFETGGAVLSERSTETLDLLGRLLTRNDNVRIAIVGHSDTDGGLEANLDLSKARAEAVRTALVARSVPEEQIEAHGVGWLAPIASNATPEGRARNRRVELVVISQPEP